MIKKSLIIFLLLVFTSYVSSLVFFNSTAVDLIIFPEITSLTKGFKLSNFNLGVIFLLSMFLGFLLAWLFTAYLVFIGAIKRKKIEYDYRKSEQFINSILEAREAEAGRNWGKAKNIWLKIQSKDPSKVFANVEISKVLEHEGKINEALSLIDAARAAAPDNIEVLFRAVDLNMANNNLTAALDNLALILAKSPNQKAALKARNLSLRIDRLADSLEYNDRAADLGNVPDYNDFKTKVELRQILENEALSPAERKKLINKLIKKNKSYTDSYLALAELHLEDGEATESISLLLKATSISGNYEYRNQAIKTMIANDQPEKALATIKTALKSAEGLDLIQSLVDQIKVNLILNKIEDAEVLIKDFPKKIENTGLSDKHAQDFLYLKGLCLDRLNKSQESAKIWIKLSNQDFDITDETKNKSTKNQRQKPDPHLSTP